MSISFDFIESAGNGYRFVWTERRLLLRLAALPVLLKFVLYAPAAGAGLPFSFPVQALIMLPAYLAEGWLVAFAVRRLFFGPQDESPDRRRGLKSAAVMYALLRFLQTGAVALLGKDEDAGLQKEGPPETDIGGGDIVLALLGFVAALYAFRFLWLYIPLAVNMSAAQIRKLFRPATLSVYMLATWLICVVPALFALSIAIRVFIAPYADAGAVPAGPQILMSFLQVALDTFAALVSTIGIACGLRQMATGQKTGKRK